MSSLSPIALEDQDCSACRFFIGDLSPRGPMVGRCHRHAPIIRDGRYDLPAVWPVVTRDDWCGEFVAHPDDGGPA